jgi:hypothetical protein
MKKLINWFTTIFQSESPNVPPKPPAPPPQLPKPSKEFQDRIQKLRDRIQEIDSKNQYFPPEDGALLSEIYSERHPVPPLKFEVDPDVEEIAKINKRMQTKSADNSALNRSFRVERYRNEILNFILKDNYTEEDYLELIEALNLAQQQVIKTLHRKRYIK